MAKTYIAQRQLQVGEGFIQPGEAYPTAAVNPSLESLAWVVEGVGPMPGDKKAHDQFTKDEKARHGAAKTVRKAKGAKAPKAPPVGIGEAFPDLPVTAAPEPAEALVGGRKKKMAAAAPAKPAAKSKAKGKR